MFGKILFITENLAHVENIINADQVADLMNVNVVFEAPDQAILGEVQEINEKEIIIRFLGEFINGKYLSGILRKPVLNSKIRIINDAELKELFGTYSDKSFIIGQSAIYKGYTICANINNLLSNHTAIFGNSGSGKSCGVSRLIQNIFGNTNLFSYNANIFIFDAYGEYKTAFTELHKYNPNYCYKFITTIPTDPDDFLLQIPFHLLSLDDLTLLLQADNHSQLPIIERALKLTKIFSKNDETAARYKNHLIAKALMAILYSNQITANKKNEIFKILEVCNTPEFSFNSSIQGLGYTRSFSECLEIDSNGNFGESVLITNYILGYVDEKLEMTEEPVDAFYSLRDFSKALEFTLISEGFQNNEQLYGDAILLKVRVTTILNSKVAKMYEVDKYASVEEFVTQLVIKKDKKAQVININMEDIDDVHAKVAVKIMSRIFFEYVKGRKQRASMPFHIFLEEAHRYVQNDSDTFLIGYNIFDRIAKEGRKYGILLNIISQRPVDISDTVISQCSNFLIFKMTHPRDIDYIKRMLPNISGDVVEKQKSLQPGSCVAFGSAFKLPMIIKMELPNPMPYSTNCDVSERWKGSSGVNNGVIASSLPSGMQMPQSSPQVMEPAQQMAMPAQSLQTQEPVFVSEPVPIADDFPSIVNDGGMAKPDLMVGNGILNDNTTQMQPQSNNTFFSLGEGTNTRDYINSFLMAGPEELKSKNSTEITNEPVEIQGQTFNFTNQNNTFEPHIMPSAPEVIPQLQEIVEEL